MMTNDKDYVTDKRPAHVDGRVTPDGTQAPQCLVLFECPFIYKKKKRQRKPAESCPGRQILDAFQGPPRCAGVPGKGHPPTFMTPLILMEEKRDYSQPQQVFRVGEVPGPTVDQPGQVSQH